MVISIGDHVKLILHGLDLYGEVIDEAPDYTSWDWVVRSPDRSEWFALTEELEHI